MIRPEQNSPATESALPAHTNSTPSNLRPLALLFVFALAIRLVHVAAMTASPYFTNPVIDAAEYDRIGWAIAHGQGHPDKVFWHPPGYPYFLGAIWTVAGDSYLAPRLVQALLGAFSAVLVAWIGRRLFGRAVGLGAGIAAALYGLLIYFDGELLAPTLTIACILLSVALGLSAKDAGRRSLWVAAGAAGGIATVTVVPSIVVPLCLAGFAGRRAGWAVLGLAMVVAPATARNVVRGAEFVPISYNGGVNFWLGNNPSYDQMVGIRPDVEWARLVGEPASAGVRGKGAESSYFVRKAMRWAREHPVDFALLQAHKLRLLLSGQEIYRNQAIYPARATSPVLWLLLWKIPGLAFPFGLLMPLAAVGLWVGARRALLLVAVVAGLAATVVAFFVTARYRVVMVPFLLIFAAVGARWFVEEANRTARLVAGSAALLLFFLANLGQGPMDMRMNADAEYNLGLRLGERGHVREAAAFFESAVSSRPGYAAAWLNLCACYDQLGRPDDAQGAMDKALKADAEDTVANMTAFVRTARPEVAARLGKYIRRAAARQLGVPEPSP